VPDEFPTLEVVALLGVLAVLLRAVSLGSALRSTPELARRLEAALRARDPVKARSVCDEADAPAFAYLGTALIDEVERNPATDRATLRRAADAALARASEAARRGRGRDFAAMSLLAGAIAYALGSKLGVGPVFYTLTGIGLVLFGIGPWLRFQNLRLVEAFSDRLVEAASEKGERASLSSVGPCPECGSSDELRFTPSALERVRELDVSELSACARCGAVWGSVDDPDALAKKRNLVTRVTGPSAAEEAADLDEEHEG
jgi:hypothetical protein